MALPINYTFKTRALTCTTSSTNSICSVAVPTRGKLLNVWYATDPKVAQTATGGVNITLNGSAVSGYTLSSITTSTGDSATNLGAPTADTFVKPGDVLATSCSSVVGGTTTFLIKEF